MERVIVPKLDLQTQEIEIIRWHRREGERVDKEELLLEISTDKAVVDIAAPTSGILCGTACSAGDKVKVGDTLAYICAEGEAAPAFAVRGSQPRSRTRPAAAAVAPQPPVGPLTLRSSPVAKRLCQENSVTVEEVYEALGKEPVGEREVRAYLASRERSDRQAADYETVELSSRRRIIARRVEESARTIPHIYLFGEATVTRLEELKGRLSQGGRRVTLTDLFVWTLGAALVEFPAFNATTAEEGRALVVRRHRKVNVGLAVSTEQGLVVPVLKDVARKTLAELALEKEELLTRARSNKLSPQDLLGATFTLSNLGMYGVGSFTAVINPPEVAILAVGAASDRLTLRAGKPASISVVGLCLGLDHRVLDGAEGGRFLSRFVERVESPPDLLPEG
jgi:pyruvate dehydrogenase E2 component (dihydrolipoamide acetyltransferase)